jgi:segregation and condensation protein A
MASTYTVSVGSFEGPFDLLLHLIARQKLDIYDVPLAQITDDYLAVIRQLDILDLDVATEFLIVAATLIELKAARLLPGEDDPELEELALEARDLLYARLLDYRTFKEAAAWLAERLEGHVGYVPRQVPLEERFRTVFPRTRMGVSLEDFAALAARALADKPEPAVDVSHLQPVRMTVREAAGMVVDELARAGGRASFRELTAGCRHRIEVIVYFLAVLELFKFDHVDVEQQQTFGEVVVTANPDVAWSTSSFAAMDVYEVHGEPDGTADDDLTADSETPAP